MKKTTPFVFLIALIVAITMQVQICFIGSSVKMNQSSITITQDVVAETIQVMEIMAKAFVSFGSKE